MFWPIHDSWDRLHSFFCFSAYCFGVQKYFSTTTTTTYPRFMGWASVDLFVSLFVDLFVCSFVYLSVCLLICLFVCLFRIVCSLQKVRLGKGLIRDSWAGLRGTLHYNLLPPKQKLLRIKCVITRISGREHCFYSRQYGMGGMETSSGISCLNILYMLYNV